MITRAAFKPSMRKYTLHKLNKLEFVKYTNFHYFQRHMDHIDLVSHSSENVDLFVKFFVSRQRLYMQKYQHSTKKLQKSYVLLLLRYW